MDIEKKQSSTLFDRVWNRIKLDMQTKLVVIFLIVKIIPIVVMAIIAWFLIVSLGNSLRETAVNDSIIALNDIAVENIERMTTDTAQRVADFLYARDDDILYLSSITPSEENYRRFIEANTGRLTQKAEWRLSFDGRSWVSSGMAGSGDLPPSSWQGGVSQNEENNDRDGFHYFEPHHFDNVNIPLYDEITFIDTEGNELVKVVSHDSPKKNYPMDPAMKNVSLSRNTYIKAESYFEALLKLNPGEIYVSDVIGAYVGSNYIGMYAPEVLKNNVAETHPNFGKLSEIGGLPPEEFMKKAEAQAYAGKENPNGQRFEGIIRWAAPVTDEDGEIIGYVTFALNHDHIMEFVDYITPMYERYTELPSAYEGNYAFIWDYKCRSICHPRHHSIVGFDAGTGKPQVPWLESSIYDAWQESGIPEWYKFIENVPIFDNQSRSKRPAPELTGAGLLGLDGRYLNNAPQCTGWMDLTAEGGSGSFYILWSGLYKLTTAAAIPYYTGQYAPSFDNGYSKRGFGFVTIGAGIDDFTQPALETEEKLNETVSASISQTGWTMFIYNVLIVILVVFVAIWIAAFLTRNIKWLIIGIDRFRKGERQFRFNASVKDEFGILADSFDEMADSIVGSVKNPLVITDLAQKVIYINNEAQEYTKLSAEETIGRIYADISVYPVGSEYDPIKALREDRESSVMLDLSSGKYLRGKANYLLSKEGVNIGYIIETLDVTDMVKKQVELEKAVEEANRANEHKGEFLARMSHEIRTPMNAIIGLTKIVKKKIGDEKGNEHEEIGAHIDQIETSSQHLLGLLNDILDISKIEAGKISLLEEVVDLKKLTDTVRSIIKPRCDEKNIKFTVIFDAFERTYFVCDSLRLRQVLINLLGNAVKFTPELGSIEFIVEKKEESKGGALVRFVIRDSGIGVSKEAQAVIFKPFEQESGNISKLYGGTGLGLAISRNIVGMFGGEIELKSEPGKGSEFSFEIWLKEAQKQDEIEYDEEAHDESSKFTGKRMLLVDDVDINRMIIMSLLEDTGISIDEAVDGADALEKFKASPVNGYDIILMDVQMPVMDGFSATAAIRALDRPDAKSVLIVALTANAFQDDIEKTLASGMDAHLNKPVEIDRLFEIMRAKLQ